MRDDTYSRDQYGRTFFHVVASNGGPLHLLLLVTAHMPNAISTKVLERDAFVFSPLLQPPSEKFGTHLGGNALHSL